MTKINPDLKINVVNSIDEAKRMLEWIKREDHDVIGFDIETTGLDPREPGAAIRLAQMGGRDEGWAVPWKKWSGVFLECMEEWQGPLIAHNLSFEYSWLRTHADWQAPWHRLHDTMIMAQVSESHLPADLKGLADRHVDRKASVGQKILKEAMKQNKWTWATIPDDYPIYYQYGVIDTVITVLVYDHFRADLKFPESYELEMAARRICSEMEYSGVRVDLPYCEEQMEILTKYVSESKEWAKNNWNVNISAPAQVADLFQTRLGQSIEKRTPKGAPSMDKEQLSIFAASDDPVVSEVATFIDGVKKADKKANSYFKNFLNMNHNGLLYPNIKTAHARTGRMSVVNPALQTISKVDTQLRDAFIPRNEGEVILSVDYSQVELRLMAHFSGDEGLINAFHVADETGSDFFTEMGKGIYDEPDFKKSDKRRNLIKTFIYAFLYGAGLEKMANSAGVPEYVMKEFIDKLYVAYPGIPEFQQKVIKKGEFRERTEGQGYVVTPTGKKIYCDKGEARTLVNYLLQGTAGEVLKKALVRLDASELTPRLLLPIHDEVLASVPRDDWEYYAKEIGDLMSVRGEFAVDLIAEPEGPFDRWGDKIRG